MIEFPTIYNTQWEVFDDETTKTAVPVYVVDDFTLNRKYRIRKTSKPKVRYLRLTHKSARGHTRYRMNGKIIKILVDAHNKNLLENCEILRKLASK